ncbi:hypothetical protein KR026_012063 [Drosophila bipectinata]|nr:hypothetical protein KR026_012063 [Drosophila bipectinata]
MPDSLNLSLNNMDLADPSTLFKLNGYDWKWRALLINMSLMDINDIRAPSASKKCRSINKKKILRRGRRRRNRFKYSRYSPSKTFKKLQKKVKKMRKLSNHTDAVSKKLDPMEDGDQASQL